MHKMPTIFIRDEENRSLVTREPHPDCDWVFAGEGIATQKMDGTCCAIDDDGTFWKRRMVRPNKPEPADFILCTLDPDPITGKKFGWVQVTDDPNDKHHREAFERLMLPQPGTYELVGPSIQNNPEGLIQGILIRHESMSDLKAPRDYDGLREFLAPLDMEGIVFQHPDGRMAKIKKKDFGLSRQPETEDTNAPD